MERILGNDHRFQLAAAVQCIFRHGGHRLAVEGNRQRQFILLLTGVRNSDESLGFAGIFIMLKDARYEYIDVLQELDSVFAKLFANRNEFIAYIGNYSYHTGKRI